MRVASEYEKLVNIFFGLSEFGPVRREQKTALFAQKIEPKSHRIRYPSLKTVRAFIPQPVIIARHRAMDFTRHYLAFLLLAISIVTLHELEYKEALTLLPSK